MLCHSALRDSNISMILYILYIYNVFGAYDIEIGHQMDEGSFRIVY